MATNPYANFKTIVIEEQLYPLTNIQEQIWITDKLSSSSNGSRHAAWCMPAIYEIEGELDIERISRCFKKLVNNHDVLRYAFKEVEGKPQQYLQDNCDLDVDFIDMSGENNDETVIHINRYLSDFVRTRFDLLKPPLVKVCVLKRSENRNILACLYHHLVADGISIGVIEAEISDMYSNIFDSEHKSGSYLDYITHQQLIDKSEAVKFWVDRLRGSKAVTKLFDRSIDSHIILNPGGDVGFQLNEKHYEVLKEYCVNKHTTPFVYIASLINLLIGKYTNEGDVTLGCPVSGRDIDGFSKSIGCFLNTIAIRTEFLWDDSFEDLIEKTRLEVAEIFDREIPSFKEVVKQLDTLRDIKRNPVFEIMLNYSKVREQCGLAIDECEVTRVTIKNDQPKYPLTFYVTESPAGMSINLNYDSNFISDNWAGEILRQFELVLHETLACPQTRLKDISTIHRKTEEKLGARFSKYPDSEKLEPDSAEQVISKIVENGRSLGEKEALTYNGEMWTYRKLGENIEKVSAMLNDRGYHQRVISIIGFAEPDVVASIIGVMASGNIALTIDASTPKSRISQILQNSAVELLLLGDDVCSDSFSIEEVLHIRELLAGKVVYSNQSPPSVTDVHDIAYILYTSGTTGEPKKVEGRHHGLNNFISWQSREFKVNETDRCSLLTNLSFDVSLRDILLPLYNGATLCIPQIETKNSGEELLTWMNTEKITIANIVPSLASKWLDSCSSVKELTYMRITFFAGEPLHRKFVQRYQTELAHTGLIVNLYGPSETTLAKCWSVVDPLRGSQKVFPVDQVIEGSEVYIAGKSGNRCGIGEIGEIVIRTPFLAIDGESDCFYTGDSGHIGVDGKLYFDGRENEVIKIAGVKVNPLEMESYLSSKNNIAQAVVLAGNKCNDEFMLYAFYTTETGKQIDSSELRFYMRQFVYQSVIPRKFIHLNSIPIKANGKIDKNALRRFGEDFEDNEADYVPPSNNIERRLERIWFEIISNEQIGITADYFALGGDSMGIIRMSSLIRDEFNYSCNPDFIFENNTIRKQAAALSRNVDGEQNQHSSLVALGGKKEANKLYCFHPRAGHALVFNEMLKYLKKDWVLYGFQALGIYDKRPALNNLNDIVDRYLFEISQLDKSETFTFIGYSFGGLVALALSRRLSKLGKNAGVILLDSISPSVNIILSDQEACAGLMMGWSSDKTNEELKEMLFNLGREQLIDFVTDFRQCHEPLKNAQAAIDFKRELKVYLAHGDVIRENMNFEYEGDVVLLQAKQSEKLFGEYNGWENNIKGNIDVFPVEGDHESILNKEYVGRVSQIITNCLGRA
uniref:AMP-dependent synthetase and ligase n=1 Tax=Marinomonas sp. (strain MWYL1) TaxID=400668 RepID=A6VYG1_MARMS